MGCVYQRKNKFKSVIYGGKFFNIKTTPRPFTSFLNAPSSSPSSLSLRNIHSVLLLSTIFMFWSAGSTVLDTINFRRDLGIITARLPTSFSISPRPLFHFASLNFYNKCIGRGRVVVALRTVDFSFLLFKISFLLFHVIYHASSPGNSFPRAPLSSHVRTTCGWTSKFAKPHTNCCRQEIMENNPKKSKTETNFEIFLAETAWKSEKINLYCACWMCIV